MKNIKQTGLLFEIRPTDYKVGALQFKEVNKESDWTKSLPSGERQNKPFTFDTLSCATFSGLNSVESQIKYFADNNLIPNEYISYLNEIGFDMLKEFNGSDCFTANKSGTTKRGNYLQNIWESFRKDGILPEALLPFNPNWNKFEDYINPKNINQSMIDKARKVLEVFSFAYEWVVLSKEDVKNIPKQLKQAPLHAACNSKSHAVMIYKDKYFFNSYEPYDGNKVRSVQFALKGIVTINDEHKVYTTMRIGSKGLDVKRLQRILNIKDDGIFGKNTKLAVTIFQAKNGLTIDGIVGPITRAYLNNL